jgi:hypothetical protein
MISPSNSGTLSRVGDVVTLTRDQNHDAVGVQIHGDGDGVELIFEGSVGVGFVPIDAEANQEPLQPKPTGRYEYLLPARGMQRVQVRLAAIKGGSVQVAIYSGQGDTMKLAAGPPPKPGVAVPVKLNRIVPPVPAAGTVGPFRTYQSAGKWYAIDDACGRASEPFRTKAEAERYAAAQMQLAKSPAVRPVIDGVAPPHGQPATDNEPVPPQQS